MTMATMVRAPEQVVQVEDAQVGDDSGSEDLAMDHRLPAVSMWRRMRRFVIVAAVLFGFGALRVLDWIGARWAFYALTGRRAQYERLTAPVAFRMAFETLGPTYVKLGQLVASGEALFPRAYSEEFRTLLDRVPPIGFEAIRETVEHDLGARMDTLFADFDEAPIAAASIAQVHAATLLDGTDVVVKVQRPGIREIAAADVALMRVFARVASAVSVHARRANALAVIEDFELNLVIELDFDNEARRMREFNEVMQAFSNHTVAAPLVHEERTSARVLTMERFDGWRLDDTVAILASPYDPEERLITGIRAWFQTLISRGFFHGDVHAGNFMLLKDGRIGYLDFGIVGVFDDDQKKNVLEYVLGFQSRDFERVGRSMLAMGTATEPDAMDMDRFFVDLEAAYAPMIDPVAGFKMRELVPSMMKISRAYSLRMPRDLVLVTKQLVYLDRYSRAYGGNEMNVLTDQRLSNLIMQDMFAAMFA
jgi:predicted unusual protein kinase regulating ubiquinone biosynthesis (AarF/ABC1/UbiB family)